MPFLRALYARKGEDNIWPAFRREAAKDILAGMMAHPRISYGSNYEDLAQWAIAYADELIYQLKEDKARR